jgi:mevalonyl-CoA ligase
VLESHHDIAAVAVVGIPDAYWGEIIGAFVQRTAPTTTNTNPTSSSGEPKIGKKEIKLWLRNRIAPHKVPEQFFWIGEEPGVPDELPINNTGKILKAELRAVARSLVEGRVAS